MSKQDIEKRLGFAAQGVKAEMAHIPGITGEAYEPNPQGTHRYKVGDQVKDKRHPSFQGTIKRLMRDKYGYPSYVVYTQGGGPQDAQDSDLVLAARPGVKAKFGRFSTEFGFLANQIKNQPDLAKKNIIVLAKKMGKEVDITRAEFEQLMQYAAKLGMETQVANAHDDVRPGFSRPGAKAKFEKEYVLWGLPKGETDRLHEKVLSTQAKTPAQMEDVKKRAAAAGWHSFRVQILDLSKPYKGFSRPGAKAKMATSDIIVKKDAQYIYYYPEDDDRATFADDNGKGAYTVKSNRTGKPVSAKTYRSLQEAVSASNAMNEKLPPLKKAKASRPGAKAEMALTISTVGAKNLCYEALANLGELAKLASETKSGWGFHVTVMTDHVKSAMSKLESSPAQAGEYLSRAIDTLGMLRKIDSVRLNDNQKGSLKQLIGYVAKSLRDAKANIKVVTTASRPGAKAKMAAFYPIEVVNSGSVTSTMNADQFRAWAVNNVAGVSRSDSLGTIIKKFNQIAKEKGMETRVRLGNTLRNAKAKAKMAAEIASDPRDKDFEKLKTLKGVVHQGKGFYIIPNKLMTPERRTKVKRSTQRYELSNMGDLVGWGTNHPNVNDYRLKDWAEAFA